MKPNPYQSGTTSIAAPETRATRWMLWAGGTALVLAVLCLITTVAGMMWSFSAAANSPPTANPSDLAAGVSNTLIPSMAAVPLAVIGIVMVILGFARRKPVNTP